MIIISTNRNINPEAEGHKIFGNKISDLDNRYAVAKFIKGFQPIFDCDEDEDSCEDEEDCWEVDLCPAGAEESLFDDIVSKQPG